MAKFTVKLDGRIIRTKDKVDVTDETACTWIERDEGGIEKSVTYREIADFLSPLKESGSFRMDGKDRVRAKVMLNEVWRTCEFHPEVIGYMEVEDFVAKTMNE